MGRAVDLFVVYRFLKLLVTPWKKQEAYKLGIIDKDGKHLKNLEIWVQKQKDLHLPFYIDWYSISKEL